MQTKLIIFLFAAVGFFSCSERENKTPVENSKIKAVVSILPYKNFIEVIGGETIEVETIIPPGTSAHSFEVSPEKLKSIEKADFYFKVGGPFEFERILMDKFSFDTSKVKIVDCSKGINFVDNDPHVWLSPGNAGKIVSTIAEALKFYYPDNSSLYQNNLTHFLKKLDSLESRLNYEFSKLGSKQFMVYHGAWGYFARYFNLEEIPFEAEGKTLKAKDFKKAIETGRSINARAIFADPHHDPAQAKAVAEELNNKVEFLDPLPEEYLKNLTDVSNKLIKYLK